MATKLNLSKITRIALRDCWDYEDRDFTPWLAHEENIAILADALGIPELEVKAKEEHVGPFRADFLCAIPGTDKLVLIENQLEKTFLYVFLSKVVYAQRKQYICIWQQAQ